jgi:methionine biosynthesis protein MetW
MTAEHRIISEWVARGSSVLDLGCGSGELLEVLVREKGVAAQGIEIDEAKIYDCVARGLSVHHGDLDAGLSEYSDASFDYVVLHQSLQQVIHPHKVLREALRVGNKVIVGFPNFAHWKTRLQILFSGRTPVTPNLPYKWYETPNLHFLSIADFEDYCREEGIRVQQRAFLRGEGETKIWPNWWAENAIFLIGRN